MLKKIRTALAALCLIGFLLLFLVPGAPEYFPGLELLAKVQLVPAILSGSLAIVSVLVLLTLLFGRVYCSILCPLGLLQDVLAKPAAKKRFRFRFGNPWLRTSMLLAFIAALATGIPVLFSVLEPYSIFGRVAASAAAAGRAAGGLVSGTDTLQPWTIGPAPMAAASLFVVIAFMAWKYGRLWCNTFCPVGTFLGWISRFSLFRIRIDQKQCIQCGLCETACKSSCLDAKEHKVDGSRCVACFTCVSTCRHQAITFNTLHTHH